MRTLFTLVALFTTLSAQATSLNPCTPIIQAKPSILNCSRGDVEAYIHVYTLMSDRARGCTEANGTYFEYNTAKVELNDQRAFTIKNNDFTYSLGHGGTGTFVSKKFGLKFRNCISPMHGGVSFAN